MPRNVKKQNLPSKVCVVCGRPFTWRKKWEKVWDEVSCCSKSCNGKRRAMKQKENRELSGRYEEESRTSLPDRSPTLPKKDTEDEEVLSECSSDELVGLADSDLKGGIIDDPKERAKKERKLAKKLRKSQRRAEREGRGDPSAGQKSCDICLKSVDLLIRCTTDETAEWKMVCGKCWKGVSGGVVDGDAAHPYYRYGGLWKNRRASKA